MTVGPLAGVAALSVAAFESQFVGPCQPVVLRGAAAEWPAHRQWTLEYLRAAFSSIAVTAARTDGGVVTMDQRTGLLQDQILLGEFIDALRNGSLDRYVMTPLRELPDRLCCDVPAPPYSGAATWRAAKLWIGPSGTVTGMHRDLADNVHSQISGRKRFTLVAPHQSALLYPNTLLDGVPNGCRANIERPDFGRFPKLRRVKLLVAELEAGDAIYIPRRWWHHVRALDVSISVNHWWASGARRWLVLAAEYFKRVRGISR